MAKRRHQTRSNDGRSKPASRRAGRNPRAGRSGESYPGWRDLETSNKSRHPRTDGWDAVIGDIPTTRVLLGILLVAGLLTLYVGHIYATQQLLDDMQSLRRENLALHLRHNRVKGSFDQASGPSVIYERAGRLGLKPASPTDPVITVSTSRSSRS